MARTAGQEAARVADLLETQSLISKLIRATDGVERTLTHAEPHSEASSEVAAERLLWARELAATVRSDARLGAIQRLEVYANAYFYRILDCLAEDYPVLVRSLGQRRFHDLITGYLLAHPSDHFSMRQVGRHLAEYLRHHEREARLRRDFPWAPDLARLEWSLLDAFDAPDVAPATREDFAQVEPDDFVELQFFFDPSLQCLAVDARAARLHDQPEDAEPDPGQEQESPAHVLVWRTRERVRTRGLDADEAYAIACVSRGMSFGEVCLEIAGRIGEERASGQVAAWLGGWLEAGCLARAHV